jgi:PPK2 family polyphosphate:nucleotide phosphotransferase
VSGKFKTDPSTSLRADASWTWDAFSPSDTPGFKGDSTDAAALMARQGERLSQLQEKLFANGRSGGTQSVLLVLQGMDTSGKGGIVRHVIGTVDPQGIAHRSFGVPTEEERSHHYLWRIRNALPPAGLIGVFDRSHYEDVLVVRVHDLVPDDPWDERYAEINAFEKEVADAGTVIVKCALLISPEEQFARLRERLERPDKYWKFKPGDIDERAHWNEYMDAYQAAIRATSTDIAPWYTIPADNKWFARLAISQLLLEALEWLNLSWPAAEFSVAEQMARLDEMGEAAPN